MSEINYDIGPRLEGESNWEWCERQAAAIPPEYLLSLIFSRWERSSKTSAAGRLNRYVMHGGGVRNAIAERYLNWKPENIKDQNK